MIRLPFAAGIALIAGALLAAGAAPAPAPAQNTKQPQAGEAPQTGAPDAAETTGQPAETPPQSPVLLVTSIEVMRSQHPPALDIIRVRGLASSDGWTDPELEPLTEGTPSDAILDMVLVAHAPAAPTGPTGFVPIEAIFPIEADHPFKGVRVRGAANALLLKAIPGYAEAPTVAEDCSACVGKLFLSTGASLPAGTQAADAVRQEDLPSTLRVVRPNDGVASVEHDPNRLTVVIGDDGRIVDAGWD